MDQAAIKAELLARMTATRLRTLKLLELVPDEDIRTRVHDFYSPIGWHFGHVARTEEYWVIVKALGREPKDPYLSWLLADLPDNPKDNRTKIMERAGLLEYMAETRAAVFDALEEADLNTENRLIRHGYGWDFADQHECQHQETIAELLTLLNQKRGAAQVPTAVPEWKSSVETAWIPIEGGEFTMGSDHRFGYDNEKRAHACTVAPFAVDAFPVTAYHWSRFIADRGYETASLWSEAGWDWNRSNSISLPEYWLESDGAYFAFGPFGIRAVHPDEPVGSISWHEAEAYCQWVGARMLTEKEWEFLATPSSKSSPDAFTYPWGMEEPTPTRAVFGLNLRSPQPVHHGEAGSVKGLAGNLWEWTRSPFLPYPGFEAFPYDGYSKDHMKGAHYCCRGGSFATSPGILRSTFRNWYVPSYRQGFLGLRLARSS